MFNFSVAGSGDWLSNSLYESIAQWIYPVDPAYIVFSSTYTCNRLCLRAVRKLFQRHLRHQQLLRLLQCHPGQGSS
jgi:hypothetical protein